jgi:DNA-binding IclR family transcriptional regulator|tara:strand:+ start:302 stop:517 length:216 start_codon:yes stop_codon:yes gene_type:complete
MLATPAAEDGFTYVAIGAIARDTSISANGVRRCLKGLKRRGVISAYDDGDWARRVWKYIIHLDAIPMLEAA